MNGRSGPPGGESDRGPLRSRGWRRRCLRHLEPEQPAGDRREGASDDEDGWMPLPHPPRRAVLVNGPHDGHGLMELEVILWAVGDPDVRIDSNVLWRLLTPDRVHGIEGSDVAGRVFDLYVWDGGFNHEGDRLLAYQGRHDFNRSIDLMRQVQRRHRAR